MGMRFGVSVLLSLLGTVTLGLLSGQTESMWYLVTYVVCLSGLTIVNLYEETKHVKQNK